MLLQTQFTLLQPPSFIHETLYPISMFSGNVLEKCHILPQNLFLCDAQADLIYTCIPCQFLTLKRKMQKPIAAMRIIPVSYTHLRAHETPEHLVCRLLLEK